MKTLEAARAMKDQFSVEGSKCKNCKHWVDPGGQRHPADNSKNCRRYPPSVFPTQTPLGSTGFISTWPSTQPGYGCGEFEAKIITEDVN